MMQLVGWLGALLSFGAYVLTVRGTLTPQSRAYLIANVAAAGLLGVVTARAGVWASVALNAAWGGVAVRALWRQRR